MNLRKFPCLKFAVLAAAVAALFMGGFSYLRVANLPETVEISGGPFQKTYLVHTRNFGDAGQITAYLIVQTGEKDLDGIEGRLHYVEHLSAQSAMGDKGDGTNRDSNAWTNNASVGYWLASSKSGLKESLATLARVLDPIKVPADFASQERDIIQREYDYRLGNNPDARIADALDRYMYAGSGLARSPMGQKADIAQFDLQQAMALHDSTHLASNAVLVVVGDLTADEVRGALPSKKVVVIKEVPKATFKMGEPISKSLPFPDEPLSPKIVWRRLVELPEAVPYDLLVLRCNFLQSILLADLPGGLAKPLRYDAFIASSFDINIQAIDERHVELRFSGNPDKNVKLADLQAAFEKALAQTAASGIPHETFQRMLARLDQSWPDANDARAQSEWMKDNVLGRVSSQQKPPTLTEFHHLESGLTETTIYDLLGAIAGKGRTGIAMIGKETD